jgi:CHAD domain-containing protein
VPSLLVFEVDAERAHIPQGDRIGDDEPVGVAIRRICVERIDRAIAELSATDRDAGVHNARKSLKRVRAMIRLVRDTVGYRAYREINVVLRDTARRLAPVRDGAVMVDVVDRLVRHNDLDPGSVADTRRRLVAAHTAASRAVLDDVAAFLDTTTALRVVRRRLSAWPVDNPGHPLAVPDEYASIAEGVARVYGRGLRGLRRAADDESAESFHEWRKRVKYLRYQLEALHRAWPEVVGATAASLDTLGELLGEEHDHAVFQGVVDRHPEFRDAERSTLAALSAAEQVRLRMEALRLGRRLYAERPVRFAARIGAYWEAWRGTPIDLSQEAPGSGR